MESDRDAAAKEDLVVVIEVERGVVDSSSKVASLHMDGGNEKEENGGGSSGCGSGSGGSGDNGGGGGKVGCDTKDTKDDEKPTPPPPTASFGELFRFADGLDFALMMIGTVGAVVHGCSLPIFLRFFADLVNSFGSNSGDPDTMVKEVVKVCLSDHINTKHTSPLSTSTAQILCPWFYCCSTLSTFWSSELQSGPLPGQRYLAGCGRENARLQK